MSLAGNHHKIHYIEFAASDVARAKQFYSAVFGWEFKDWGPEYIDFAPNPAASLEAFASASQRRRPAAPRH